MTTSPAPEMTETENVLLEKIAIDLSEKTQSGTIKMMVASQAARKSAFVQIKQRIWTLNHSYEDMEESYEITLNCNSKRSDTRKK